MRSWLFVPGDSERKAQKAAETAADVIILDLEDSVTDDAKAIARALAPEALALIRKQSKALVYVRVNGLETGWTDDDLAAVIPAQPDGVMLPKAEGGASVSQLSTLLRTHEAQAGLEDDMTKIIAIATETPAGIFAAPTYSPAHPRLAALTWGGEDLSAVVGARAQTDENGNRTPLFEHARTTTLLAAANASCLAIDSICADFKNIDGLERECRAAKRDGFAGKLAIHPAQVDTINACFSPSADEIDHARAVIALFEANPDAGAVSFGGRMLDKPHLTLARRVLAQATCKT